MKDKLKNLLKNKAFIGCTAGVLVLAIVITAILLLPDRKTEPVSEPETSGITATDTVPDIDTPVTEPETSLQEADEIPTDISIDTDNTVKPDADVQTGGKAENPAAPVTVKEPEKPTENNGGSGGGIIIGDGGDTAEYSCGCANHHCQDADTHAYILNLELEGCPICGSHSCPSFYATDEWDGAALDFTKCPEYSDKSDPTKYCQECGREKWSVNNPTGCFRYLLDTQCECGEFVKGNTCHHH